MRGEASTTRWPRSGLALLLGVALAATASPARAQAPIDGREPAPTSFGPPPAWTPPGRPVLVDLRFSPPRTVRDAILRISPQQPNLPATSERPIHGPTMTLSLPPGLYMLNVGARRHEASLSLEVKPGMYPVEVQLTRRRASRGDAPRFLDNDRMTAALGGAALMQLIAGAGVLIVGSVRQASIIRRNENVLMDALVDTAGPTPEAPSGLALVEERYPIAVYHRDLSRSMTLGVAGGAVVMSGVGAALTAFAVANHARRRAAYAGLGVGAAFLAGGAVALVFAERDREAMLAIDDPTQRFTQTDRRSLGGARVAGTLLTGLGVGLVLFPAIALIGDKVRRNRMPGVALTPSMGPGQAGFVLHGRF